MRLHGPNPPRSIGWVLIVAVAALTPVFAGVEEDADRAWGAGDHELALELYEQVLDEHPGNFRALLRSAKMLSWIRRFDESIARYNVALAVEPDDYNAALGRARVLSWAGRYKEARAGFEALCDRNPEDVDAQLGLARSFAWAGRLPQARTEYARVLEIDPGNVDARVGLAYLDLWTGEVGDAADQSRELSAEHPDHEEVVKLGANVSRSAGAWWSVAVDQIDDTDDNRLQRFLVNGGLGLGKQVRLDLGYGHYDMSDPAGDASIDNVNATFSFFPGKGQRVAAHVGYDWREATTGATDGDMLGGLTYSRGHDKRWQFSAAAQRMAVRYSPTITDNGITFDQLALRAGGAVGERWRVSAGVGTADASDGNSRVTADAGFLYRVPVRRVRLQVGYTLRFMDYDEDLDNGYFDPQSFVAHLAQLRVADEYGKRGNYYRLYLDTGVQSFTIGATDVSGDTVLVAGGTAGFPVAKRMVFEVYAERGDYAATTAAGFESTLIGVRLIWRAGL
jgi:tetratricopeptide (TPR) repeat protein